MAASILTLFLNNPVQSGSSAGLLTLTQPTASTSTTGWTVGTITTAFPYSSMSYNVERGTTEFTSAVLPNGPPATAAGHLAEDCWRLSANTTGQFSLGTWYSAMSVIAVTNGGAQDGNALFRIWRSANADGSGAIELTASRMTGTTVTNLSTTVAQTSSASTRIAASNLTNEYVFLQVAWQISGAGGNANADVLTRVGPITSLTAGSMLVTSAFSSITPVSAAGGGYYLDRRSNDPMCSLDEL